MAEYLDFFNIYIMGVMEMLFHLYFLVKILKKKLWIPFYFLFAVCGVTVVHFLPTSTFMGFAALVFLFTVCGVLGCHGEVKPSLLYAVLTVEIILLCYRIGVSLAGLLCPFLSAVFCDRSGIPVMLAGEVASLVLAGFCYYVMYRYFSMDAFYPMDVFRPVDARYPFYATVEMQQMFLVFIPILMIFIMSKYVNVIQFEFQFADLGKEGFPNYVFNYWQLLVMNFLGLASLFCILFSYKKLQQNFRLSTELSLLEQEEHSLNQYVEEARTRYDRTKAFRHDIRNHIAVVKNLLQGGKLEEAVRYMEDMDDMAEKMSFPVSTNNPVVDILLENKLGIAKSMGIRAQCSLLLPYPCGLKDIDICIVLSNALDNAIRACKSLDTGIEKYIHVSGCIQGDFLMMEIENTFQGKGIFKKGTGLANVKKVAEKYGGAMSIEAQMNVFALRVLLIIPQHPEYVTQQMDENTGGT